METIYTRTERSYYIATGCKGQPTFEFNLKGSLWLDGINTKRIIRRDWSLNTILFDFFCVFCWFYNEFFLFVYLYRHKMIFFFFFAADSMMTYCCVINWKIIEKRIMDRQVKRKKKIVWERERELFFGSFSRASAQRFTHLKMDMTPEDFFFFFLFSFSHFFCFDIEISFASIPPKKHKMRRV